MKATFFLSVFAAVATAATASDNMRSNDMMMASDMKAAAAMQEENMMMERAKMMASDIKAAAAMQEMAMQEENMMMERAKMMEDAAEAEAAAQAIYKRQPAAPAAAPAPSLGSLIALANKMLSELGDKVPALKDPAKKAADALDAFAEAAKKVKPSDLPKPEAPKGKSE